MVTKRCRKCRRLKSLKHFYNQKKNKDGKRTECIKCFKKWRKGYRKANREKELAKGKEWRRRNLNKARQMQRAYSRSPAGIYASLKARAKKRGTVFTISKEEFLRWYQTQKPVCSFCKFTQDELASMKERGTRYVKRLTIDRMDNGKGYKKGNIALACYRCNGLKGDFFTYEDMQKIGRIIRARHRQR